MSNGAVRAGFSTRVPRQTALIALAICLFWPIPSHAATIDVDETTCTLVNAILAANEDQPAGGCPAGSGDDTISLAVDVTLTEPYDTGFGGMGVPVPTDDLLTILGNHHSIARADGAPKFRFMATNMTLVTLQDLTIRNFETDERGGALFAVGWLDLVRVTLSDNSSGASGGAIACYCVLDIESSTITNNGAQVDGGGIWTQAMEMTTSTVSNNTAGNNGGGLYAEISGFSVTNSTISSNSATNNGGGIYNTWTDDGPAILSSTSVVGNHAGVAGGGIYQDRRIFLGDTILGNNGAAGNCGFPTSGTTDLGNNLDDDGTCGAGFGTLTGLDPELADNGGPTLTHALLGDSSAIDAAGDCGLETDQRGVPRSDGSCDSGAYEFECYIELYVSNDLTWITYALGDSAFDIVAGNLVDLLAGGGFTGAVCMGSYPTSPAIDPFPDPGPGDGRYFLARGLTRCMSAGYGSSSLDPDPRDALLDGPCP